MQKKLKRLNVANDEAVLLIDHQIKSHLLVSYSSSEIFPYFHRPKGFCDNRWWQNVEQHIEQHVVCLKPMCLKLQPLLLFNLRNSLLQGMQPQN